MEGLKSYITKSSTKPPNLIEGPNAFIFSLIIIIILISNLYSNFNFKNKNASPLLFYLFISDIQSSVHHFSAKTTKVPEESLSQT
jgi:hypothetical protein